MEPVCCPETSVINCHYALLKIAQERISHLRSGGSLYSSEAVVADNAKQSEAGLCEFCGSGGGIADDVLLTLFRAQL